MAAATEDGKVGNRKKKCCKQMTFIRDACMLLFSAGKGQAGGGVGVGAVWEGAGGGVEEERHTMTDG